MQFQGSASSVLITPPPRCAFPGCGEWGDHQHHITYDPPVIKWLCAGHHEQITILNGQQARKYRGPLSTKFRWRIWYAWIRGELKVRRTRKSLEWTANWQCQPAEQTEERGSPEAPVISVRIEPKVRTNRKARRKAKVPKTTGARGRRKAI